ncbi:MAG: hypothetical protein A2X45_08825 [Lentisphaerae bacterium GWF2_50_93]|nr:MAG: hypothetical protein A2X45_08825 [Lentisphaerae bacterium GWF2_50_93]
MEVEVLSVQDAPSLKDPENSPMDQDDQKECKNAQAVVNITEVIKGKCGLKSLILIGGPYVSCAPFNRYLHFEKSKKLFLILDNELPIDTKVVVIRWRCRVCSLERNELNSLMDSACVAWEKSKKLHSQSAPDSYKRAESLYNNPEYLANVEKLSEEPYSVLACLESLMKDPDHVPPPYPQSLLTKNETEEVNGDENEKFVDGTYFTSLQIDYPMPPSLISAIKTKGESNQNEVTQYNKVLFTVFLKNELFFTPSQIDSIIKNPLLSKSFDSTSFYPYRFVYREARDELPDKDILTLNYLVALADDTPDSLVWKSFGISEKIDLNADMIARYIEKNMDRDYNNWTCLQVLLLAYHPKISPLIQKYLDEERNESRLDNYFIFFIKIKDYESALKVLGKYEKLAFDVDLAKLTKEQKTEHTNSILFHADNFEKILTAAHCENKDLQNMILNLRKRTENIPIPINNSKNK